MTNTEAAPAGHVFKLRPGLGHQVVFGLGDQYARWLGLELLRLATGEAWQGEFGGEEAALVVLAGRCTVALEGLQAGCWQGVGSRSDVFSGPPAAVYAPRRSRVGITAETAVELAIVKAPCEADLPPRLIAPSEVRESSVGAASWRRDVRLVIPPGSPISQRLIVGETVNPPGNWSGIPPHRHERISATENYLEELYLYKMQPVDGDAVQLLYHDGDQQTHLIGNDDVLLVLSGYHPTAAPPGVTVCYLWALSGESKAYRVAADPRFAWVGQAEATIKELQRRRSPGR